MPNSKDRYQRLFEEYGSPEDLKEVFFILNHLVSFQFSEAEVKKVVDTKKSVGMGVEKQLIFLGIIEKMETKVNSLVKSYIESCGKKVGKNSAHYISETVKTVSSSLSQLRTAIGEGREHDYSGAMQMKHDLHAHLTDLATDKTFQNGDIKLVEQAIAIFEEAMSHYEAQRSLV